MNSILPDSYFLHFQIKEFSKLFSSGNHSYISQQPIRLHRSLVSSSTNNFLSLISSFPKFHVIRSLFSTLLEILDLLENSRTKQTLVPSTSRQTSKIHRYSANSVGSIAARGGSDRCIPAPDEPTLVRVTHADTGSTSRRTKRIAPRRVREEERQGLSRN